MRVCTRFLQVVLMLLFFFFYARAILLLQAALAAEPRFRLVLKRQIEGIDRVKRQEAGSMGEGGGDQEE
jgi:hypothetical protein